jgi:LacI family transcriptional regulator
MISMTMPAVSLSRVRLADGAGEAGVGPAIVDRVLHGRPGVRPRSVERVSGVVERLKYRPDPALAARPWPAKQRDSAHIVSVNALPCLALAQQLASPRRRPGAVMVTALDHPRVRAVIAELAASGRVMVMGVSDTPSSRRAHRIGIDNVAVGRIAGNLLGCLVGPREARLGVLLGSQAPRDRGERAMLDQDHIRIDIFLKENLP